MRCRQKGLTLIEVLVALAIFTVAAAAMMGNIIASTQAEDQLRIRTYAYWVAQNRMAKVELEPHWPSVGIKSGEADKMMGSEWHWQMKVIDTSAQDLRRVDIEIRREAEQENADARLTAFIGKF